MWRACSSPAHGEVREAVGHDGQVMLAGVQHPLSPGHWPAD